MSNKVKYYHNKQELKSALGGIEMTSANYDIIAIDLLKSALGGIEIREIVPGM